MSLGQTTKQLLYVSHFPSLFLDWHWIMSVFTNCAYITSTVTEHALSTWVFSLIRLIKHGRSTRLMRSWATLRKLRLSWRLVSQLYTYVPPDNNGAHSKRCYYISLCIVNRGIVDSNGFTWNILVMGPPILRTTSLLEDWPHILCTLCRYYVCSGINSELACVQRMEMGKNAMFSSACLGCCTSS